MSLQYMYVCISAQLPPREQLREGEGEQRWAPRGDGTHRPNFAETGDGGGHLRAPQPRLPASQSSPHPSFNPASRPQAFSIAGIRSTRGFWLWIYFFFWCVCVCAVEV